MATSMVSTPEIQTLKVLCKLDRRVLMGQVDTLAPSFLPKKLRAGVEGRLCLAPRPMSIPQQAPTLGRMAPEIQTLKVRGKKINTRRWGHCIADGYMPHVSASHGVRSVHIRASLKIQHAYS